MVLYCFYAFIIALRTLTKLFLVSLLCNTVHALYKLTLFYFLEMSPSCPHPLFPLPLLLSPLLNKWNELFWVWEGFSNYTSLETYIRKYLHVTDDEITLMWRGGSLLCRLPFIPLMGHRPSKLFFPCGFRLQDFLAYLLTGFHKEWVTNSLRSIHHTLSNYRVPVCRDNAN